MTAFYAYPYVGPARIRAAAQGSSGGALIAGARDLAQWLAANPDARVEGATFVVDAVGALRLAPRRSEHVACAAGAAVLTAGELTFGPGATIASATNLSTGYCPKPESFAALEHALQRAGRGADAMF